MTRPRWRCCNGRWEFEVDAANSGEERGLLRRHLRDSILVPFAPETAASGLALEDFLPAVWYRRELEIPAEWAGARVLLHFQAVDYDTTVWVNGTVVGRHRGGFTPFSCELSEVAPPGQVATVVVRARDDPDAVQPRGKQTNRLRPYGSRCARTTGIWQSVWMEPVPDSALGRPRLTPHLEAGELLLEQPISGRRRPGRLSVELRDDGGVLLEASTEVGASLTPLVILSVPGGAIRPWCPEDPHLYGLSIALFDRDGTEIDRVESYAGLRSLSVADGAISLNGSPRFQRLVLDQGYWPESGLTAPDEDALVRDIELAMEAGFDGARLHERVAEERLLYHADRLGYLVWGEFPDWGNRRGGAPVHHLGFSLDHVGEWLEALERDYSHPSIVGWCPLNETEQPVGGTLGDLDGITRALYLATRAADRTRPVIDVSGYHHRIADADVWDCHDYEQNPEVFAAHYRRLPELVEEVTAQAVGEPWPAPGPDQPVVVSEFGGSRVAQLDGHDSGGYGEPLPSAEHLLERFRALSAALLDNDRVAGYAYTQLVDTYEEHNGLLDAARRPKVALDRLAAAQRRRAAIEARLAGDQQRSPKTGR